MLPSAETAAMLFWALLASGQITMRKVDGWQSLAERPADHIIDVAYPVVPGSSMSSSFSVSAG